jgi:hypothetical protein
MLPKPIAVDQLALRFHNQPNCTPNNPNGITNKMLRVGPMSTVSSSPEIRADIQAARLPHRRYTSEMGMGKKIRNKGPIGK